MQLSEPLQRAVAALCSKQTVEDAATTLLALRQLDLAEVRHDHAIRSTLWRHSASVRPHTLAQLAPLIVVTPTLRDTFQQAVELQAGMLAPEDWCVIFEALTKVPGKLKTKDARCGSVTQHNTVRKS